MPPVPLDMVKENEAIINGGLITVDTASGGIGIMGTMCLSGSGLLI